MIVRTVRCKGSIRERCWYDRQKKGKLRHYHVFGLCRMVDRTGSAWRLIIGPWVFAFGFKTNKGGRDEKTDR